MSDTMLATKDNWPKPVNPQFTSQAGCIRHTQARQVHNQLSRCHYINQQLTYLPFFSGSDWERVVFINSNNYIFDSSHKCFVERFPVENTGFNSFIV